MEGVSQNINKGYIPQAAGGKFKFHTEGMETGVVNTKYIFVEDDSFDQMERLTSDLVGKWDLATPQLVLTIISSGRHFKSWRNQEDMENFQDGLMKSASLADMVILVDGQSHGVTQTVGDAVAKERNRRKILAREQGMVRFMSSELLPRITVMALVPQQALSQTVSDSLSESLSSTTPGKTNILINEGDESIERDSSHLNSNLTHFLIMNKEMGPASQANFANRLEMRLTKPIGGDRRMLSSISTDDDLGPVPLIGLLIQGGPQEIDRVLALVKKNVPVIIMCGLGMAADIIAYAVRESQQSYDTYTYEMYVKTELRRLLTNLFPEDFQKNNLARNQCRDRVLQCVAYGTQGDIPLLTLVDAHSQSQDLSKVILMSVLNSYSVHQTQAEQIEYSLQLCLDWMSPELALSEIFSKYSSNLVTVSNDLFQQALLRPDREDFVEVFLDRGFVLHKFLSKDQLQTLFERCYDMDLFAGICLETILGEKVTQQNIIPDTFVRGKDCDLNRLLRSLTGLRHLIDTEELTRNAGPDRVVSRATAEKKALNTLLFWAALTHNIKLVRILWRKTSEPIAMGLTLSTLFSRMSRQWIDDHDLKLSVKRIGIEFGQLAVKVLDLAYRDSKMQALRFLTEQLPDFNNLTAIDLARLGKNKSFIAHPCCQGHIYSLWYGCVRFPRYFNVGLFEVPDFVKMILSMVLIIPSYFWIDIVHGTSYTTGFATPLPRFSIIKRATMRHKKTKQLYNNPTFARIRPVFLIQKLYYMWTAPVTKYWLTQIFYMVFLAVFSLSVMTPFCGEPALNKFVAAWLFVIVLDQIFFSVDSRLQGSDSLFPHFSALLVTLLTLIVVVVFRILRPTMLPFTLVKTILSCSLISFFYKAMGLLFPASPALGPMFLNLTTMMKQDLLRWLRIWSLTLISGGIAIHAVLYPAYPLNMSSVTRALLRGFLGLFITDISDLAGEECSCLYNYSSSFKCDVASIPETVRNRLESCPYSSAGGYFVVLLYFFDTKLVYYTLIFAICSATLSRTLAKSVEIWKYQFFLMVRDYSRRPFLPVPFVIIIHPFILLKALCLFMYNCVKKTCPCCASRKTTPPEEYNMWKVHMKTLEKKEKMEMDKRNLIKGAEQRLSDLARKQKTFRRVIQNLNDRLTELLNDQTSNSLIMEQLSETVEALRLNKMDADLPQSPQHRQCRLSPYPGTNVRRFAVFDKNVSWEEPYPAYDPPIYTKHLSEFDEAIRPYIDFDVFDIMRMRDEQEKRDSLDTLEAEAIPDFRPEYNTVQEVTARNGETLTLDRTSWIYKDHQQVTYTLDVVGVPRNPMGRTGMRGRGCLWRWGPNHAVYAIVSRWRNVFNSAGMPQGPLLVNGRKVLEILVVFNERLKEDSLPGAFVSGRTSKYSVMCEMFMRDLMGERDVPGSAQLDQDDMIQFYRQFLSSGLLLSSLIGRAMTANASFSSSLVYRGYMDDRNNTDNAWVDAEIWNFHYNSKDTFDRKIIDNERRWREVSVLMQLAGSQLHHVLEVAKMHNQG